MDVKHRQQELHGMRVAILKSRNHRSWDAMNVLGLHHCLFRLKCIFGWWQCVVMGWSANNSDIAVSIYRGMDCKSEPHIYSAAVEKPYVLRAARTYYRSILRNQGTFHNPHLLGDVKDTAPLQTTLHWLQWRFPDRDIQNVWNEMSHTRNFFYITTQWGVMYRLTGNFLNHLKARW